MRRAPLASIRAAAASLAVAVPALVACAQAQIQDTQHRWVVVAQEDTAARCDDFERFYKVATFQPGQILRLDGESDEWARIVYPASMHALVPAADARGVGEGAIQLAIDSRLRAPSAVLGIAGSWHSLYAEALPAGTRLEVVGEELGANGEVVAYRVKPPMPPAINEAPHAFVKLAALRDASDAEIQKHLASINPADRSEADVVLEDATRTEYDGPAIEQAPVTTPRRGQNTPATPPETKPGYSTDLLEPMVRPGQEKTPEPGSITPWTPENDTPLDVTGQSGAGGPAENTPARSTPATNANTNNGSFDIVAQVEQQDVNAAPGSNADASRTPSVQPERVFEQQSPSEPEPAPEPASVEVLEAALTSARKLDAEALDIALDELAAEFRRTLAAESAKPGADENIIRGLEQRVAWLELRIDTRDQRRAIDDALRVSSDRDRQVAEGVRRWQSERAYVVVGRLAPSAVYDGKRLPLMYRVQSVDPVLGPRTIAYVRPSANQDLAPRLGQIVGIVGRGSDDDALRLRIIRPDRVDELNSAFAQEPVTTE